tara:strand:+ start:4482 stop:5597 length:1116 start_codon:yes stop_codon:yes gene_type:complete
MLEQAIIDATALKEAAIKNAEAAIIEKYAPEVKKAVATLLEQEEELDLGADPAGMGLDTGPVAMETSVDLPPAAGDGESVCPCPEEGEAEEIEVDIDQLRKMALQEPEGGLEDLGALAGEPFPGEDELALQEEVDIDEDFLTALLREAKKKSKPDGDGDGVPPWADKDDDDPEVQEEEIEINEENISDIIEELVVDMEPQKTGWLGTGLPELEHAAEMEMARRQSTEHEEEKAEYEKSIKELEEQNTALKEYTFKLKEALTRLTGNLDELNLSNARLLYTNRTLSSISLNERQKNKIVQAISNAGSVEEAKTIYETLQSTVGSTPSRRTPQSLSEAVSRPSTGPILTNRRPTNQNQDNSFTKRMKELAGIK